MINAQGVWVSYGIVLSLNFLVAGKQMAPAKRHEIEKTAEIN